MPAFDRLVARPHWRTLDFISDLHLKAEEVHTAQAWRHYLLNTTADAVFILGDLFEVWVGDDCDVPGSFEEHCTQILSAATRSADLLFMRGNRDFLVGPEYLGRCGIQDLPDPTVLHFAGQDYLLTHGDLLCTDDTAYQEFRRQVRTERWQQTFLDRPLPERQALARQMRAHSEAHHAQQPVYADIDRALACRWLELSGATTLIHGHTHRPGDHALGLDTNARPLTQVVLSDWHVTPGEHRMQVLRLTAADGLKRLPPSEAVSC